MLIAGASGHARELAGILAESGQLDGASFLDDFSSSPPSLIWDRFPVLHNAAEVRKAFERDPGFIIGVGKPEHRKLFFEKLTALGGKVMSVISPHARIGTFNVKLEAGLNIMTNAVITQDITIGMGSLVHINATIHHDCRIGQFCELSPGCHLLGKVVVGDMVSIGAGTVVLPGITLGDGCVIGAGAVVTKDVPTGCRVKGVPAKEY